MAIRTKKLKLRTNHVEYQPRGESSRKLLEDTDRYNIPKQVQGVKERHVPPRKEWTKQNRQMQTPYGQFLLKYDHLEDYIDDFKPQDLCFYFREVAKENGVKYNLVFEKDCAVMKRLRQTYDSREICGMIEFLFTSDQDYLAKDRISVSILGSRWSNTVYADFKLWLDDEYVPQSATKKQKQSGKHEWHKEENDVSTIGDW